jgi:hypothetical protein
MGRQVRYRNYPEEADALEAFIRSTGDVVFVPEEKTPNPEPVDVGTLRLDLLAPPPALWGLLLARRSDLPLLRHRQLPERGLWVLDKLSSPIVEYSPGYDRNGRIRRLPGRMWFPTSSYDKATGALVRPTDDFLAWADRLMRWVRRSWTLIDGDYHSPRAVDDYPSLRHPPDEWRVVLEGPRDGDTPARVRAWRQEYDPRSRLADRDVRIAVTGPTIDNPGTLTISVRISSQ